VTEDLREAWDAWAKTRDPVAHELLVRTYLGLAGALARKAIKRAPAHQDQDDIISFARYGLLDAINKFNPDAGVKFETYATQRIAGEIIDEQRRADPLTRDTRRLVKLVERTQAEADRTLTSEEIAERIGETPQTVRRLMVERQSMAVELDADAEAITRDETALAGHLADFQRRLATRMAHLPDRHMSLLVAYYVGGRGVKETAAYLGIQTGMVSRIRSEALTRLTG
jgi:RNA polymerase sigma factor for flagellar operon FliA